MTDAADSSIHLLRPSIPGALPPLPLHEGGSLRISLGFAIEDSAGRRARIYTYPPNPTEHDATQHEDLHEGDVFRCRSWWFEVVGIDGERGVRLRLLPRDLDG